VAVSLLDAGFGEFGFDADVDGPFLTIVAKVCLDSVLKVHDALCVDTSGHLGPVGQLHFSDFGAENVGEVTIERSRATRVAGTGRTFGHSEWRLLLDLVRDQIDGSATAIDNQDSIAHPQIEQPRLRAEHGGGLGFRDERQSIVIFVAQESSLDSGGARGGLAGIVPNGRHGQEVLDVGLLAGKDLSECL
jgi:hypothetical protein